MPKINRLYFIEESVLNTNKFYILLENLINDPQAEAYFAVDSSIQEKIDKYISMGLYDEAYDIQTYLYFFKNRLRLEYIKTSDYLDFEDFMKASLKYGEVYVLTQQNNIFEAFKGLKSKMPHLKLYCVKHQNIVEWKETEKVTFEAYYPQKEEKYINKIDTDNLSYVYSPKYGYLKLDKSTEAAGGEGRCYKTYNNFFVKLYNSKHLSYVNLKKLQKMLQIDISNEYILWPLDIVYYNNNFVGYVMKELKGCYNLDDLKDFGYDVPNFDKFLDRYYVALNLLKQIEYLHKKGIIIGDLKPDNIMIRPPHEVYIIDAGSFQVEDYCCPVCNPVYTEKTYVGDELKTTLRTMEDEYFPINRILFEILVNKSPFYNRNNSEVNEEGKRSFEYPLELPTTKEKVLPYQVYWFVGLSQNMREYFYYYYKQGKITEIADLIRELELTIKRLKEKK